MNPSPNPNSPCTFVSTNQPSNPASFDFGGQASGPPSNMNPAVNAWVNERGSVRSFADSGFISAGTSGPPSVMSGASSMHNDLVYGSESNSLHRFDGLEGITPTLMSDDAPGSISDAIVATLDYENQWAMDDVPPTGPPSVEQQLVAQHSPAPYNGYHQAVQPQAPQHHYASQQLPPYNAGYQNIAMSANDPFQQQRQSNLGAIPPRAPPMQPQPQQFYHNAVPQQQPQHHNEQQQYFAQQPFVGQMQQQPAFQQSPMVQQMQHQQQPAPSMQQLIPGMNALQIKERIKQQGSSDRVSTATTQREDRDSLERALPDIVSSLSDNDMKVVFDCVSMFRELSDPSKAIVWSGYQQALMTGDLLMPALIQVTRRAMTSRHDTLLTTLLRTIYNLTCLTSVDPPMVVQKIVAAGGVELVVDLLKQCHPRQHVTSDPDSSSGCANVNGHQASDPTEKCAFIIVPVLDNLVINGGRDVKERMRRAGGMAAMIPQLMRTNEKFLAVAVQFLVLLSDRNIESKMAFCDQHGENVGHLLRILNANVPAPPQPGQPAPQPMQRSTVKLVRRLLELLCSLASVPELKDNIIARSRHQPQNSEGVDILTKFLHAMLRTENIDLALKVLQVLRSISDRASNVRNARPLLDSLLYLLDRILNPNMHDPMSWPLKTQKEIVSSNVDLLSNLSCNNEINKYAVYEGVRNIMLPDGGMRSVQGVEILMQLVSISMPAHPAIAESAICVLRNLSHDHPSAVSVREDICNYNGISMLTTLLDLHKQLRAEDGGMVQPMPGDQTQLMSAEHRITPMHIWSLLKASIGLLRWLAELEQVRTDPAMRSRGISMLVRIFVGASERVSRSANPTAEMYPGKVNVDDVRKQTKATLSELAKNTQIHLLVKEMCPHALPDNPFPY